ncbi:hypothetical protein M426DRAFT_23341 [Hypoxylon sp. CI-4A]|nr:hypothetical protein M426DRAFT_23341 [Hypoxylon sp. CI-4A]
MAPSKNIPKQRLAALTRLYNDLGERIGFQGDELHYTRNILDSEYVKPFFKEYRRDYLEVTAELEIIDCGELSRWCKLTNAFAQPKYARAKSPKKEGWTALDHATRFLVRVLRNSWENGGTLWTHGKFDPDNDERDEIYQVWATLRYLQNEWEAANTESWEVAQI